MGQATARMLLRQAGISTRLRQCRTLGEARLYAGVGEAALRELFGAFHEQDHLHRQVQGCAYIPRCSSKSGIQSHTGFKGASATPCCVVLNSAGAVFTVALSVDTHLIVLDEIINRRLQLRRKTEICVQLPCEGTTTLLRSPQRA